MSVSKLLYYKEMRDNILWKFFSNLLFYKQPVSIRSSFGVEESVRRLSKVVCWFPSLFGQSLLGSVKVHRVRIRRVIPFVGNSFAPVFYGSFREHDGITMLEGYFAMHRSTSLFLSVGLGFLCFMSLLFVVGAVVGHVPVSSPVPRWQGLIYSLLPIGMMLYMIALTKVGKWFARNDEAFIEQRIYAVLSEV